jgi:hypothetical protein
MASLVVAAALATPGSARAADTFGLAITVAEEDRAEVQPEPWIEDQIASAERLFAPIGVHFRWTIKKALVAKHARLETRADRDALASELEAGTINVFIVESLRDVDEPDRYRMGVCWRRGDGKPYVIVSATARPTVLAHELGHFFGNAHSAVPNNVMSYIRTDGDVFFDPGQIATVRATAARHVAERWIVPLGPARLLP